MNAQFHYLCSFVVKLRIDHDASRDREILANHLDSMNDELKKALDEELFGEEFVTG
jgi:hypothetical protein